MNHEDTKGTKKNRVVNALRARDVLRALRVFVVHPSSRSKTREIEGDVRRHGARVDGVGTMKAGGDDLAMVEAERRRLRHGDLEDRRMVAAMFPRELDRLCLAERRGFDGEADLLAQLADCGVARQLAARDAAARQAPALPVRAAQEQDLAAMPEGDEGRRDAPAAARTTRRGAPGRLTA